MARPSKHDGGLYKRAGSKVLVDALPGPEWQAPARIERTRRTGRRHRRLARAPAGQGRQHAARYTSGEASNYVSGNGRIFSWRTISKPPNPRAEDSSANERVLKHLENNVWTTMLADITAEDIETYLRRRLKARVVVQTKSGSVEKGVLKPATVHQELRVLRRMLNVAVRKKLLSGQSLRRRGVSR